MTKEFNHHIEGAEETWKTERGHLITQIEILTEKVARLQQRLAGDYTEPLFLDCRFAIPGQIANELAKIIWKGFSIPLAAKGAQQRSNGLIEIGYAYNKSQAPGELVELLNRHSNSLAKELGVHKITSVREHDLTPSIIVGLRREPEVKEDTVKRLLTPIDKLATQVLRGMAQKPTLRVMGSTGAGKGICVKYLLSIMSEYMECYIRLHDPQHGSSEDHWDIPKVSKSGAETKKALSKISQQLRDREVTKINQPITVDILDEIDTQLEKSDKEQFLDLISRIRHLGMKLILIGQNPKVNRAGFQWSDMGQMIAFYQKESALDAIKNYPALKLKEDILTKQYYQLSEAYELKNKDLDTHKQYYFGLCVIPGKTPVWYELPVADSIAINEEMAVIGETFEVTDSNQEFVEGQNSSKIEPSVMAERRQEPKSAKTETFAQQEMAVISAPSSVIPHVGGSAKSRHRAKTICKKHPGVELRQGKDGRYYCPGCQKKLRKDELTTEVLPGISAELRPELCRYLIHAQGTDRYKIGLTTRHPAARLSELNSSQSPYPLELIDWFETDNVTEDERYLHEKFASYRVHGEWFQLDRKILLKVRIEYQGDVGFSLPKLPRISLPTLSKLPAINRNHLALAMASIGALWLMVGMSGWLTETEPSNSIPSPPPKTEIAIAHE